MLNQQISQSVISKIVLFGTLEANYFGFMLMLINLSGVELDTIANSSIKMVLLQVYILNISGDRTVIIYCWASHYDPNQAVILAPEWKIRMTLIKGVSWVSNFTLTPKEVIHSKAIHLVMSMSIFTYLRFDLNVLQLLVTFFQFYHIWFLNIEK